MDFEQLPYHLLIQTAAKLNPDQLGQWCNTSKTLHEVCQTEAFWNALAIERGMPTLKQTLRKKYLQTVNPLVLQELSKAFIPGMVTQQGKEQFSAMSTKEREKFRQRIYPEFNFIQNIKSKNPWLSNPRLYYIQQIKPVIPTSSIFKIHSGQTLGMPQYYLLE